MQSGIGDRVREAREKLGLSARALSGQAGLSHGLVGHIESGRVLDPGTSTLVAIAKALRVSLQWLASGENTSSPPSTLPPPDESREERAKAGLATGDTVRRLVGKDRGAG